MAKTFILSDESLNSYGFRIITAGIQLEQFRKNPVMYFMHRRPNKYDEKVEEKLPIGIWENIRVEKNQLLADAKFDLSDPFAKKIADKVENGFLRMASLGAEPIEASSDLSLLVQGQTRETVTICNALEASIVDMGGNLNSFALSAECGCALYNKGNLINLSNSSENSIQLLKINTNQSINMKKIAIALGLSEDASEEQIIAAISANKTAVDAAKIQLAKMQDDRVQEVVKKAIADRKFTDADKDKYVQLCKADIELGTNIINSMAPQKTASELIIPGAGNAGDKPKKFTELSLTEVEDLRSNNKAKYVELYKAEYGKDPILID